MSKDEPYWGCHACGHRVSLDAVECWECEKPRQFYWLDEAGEHTATPSLAYRRKYAKQEREIKKLTTRKEYSYISFCLPCKHIGTNRYLDKIGAWYGWYCLKRTFSKPEFLGDCKNVYIRVPSVLVSLLRGKPKPVSVDSEPYCPICDTNHDFPAQCWADAQDNPKEDK